MFKILDLFRKGRLVLNPVAWKTGQITVAVLTPLILSIFSLLNYYGISLPFLLDEVVANQLATAFISIVTIVCTLISSDKVGILPPKSEDIEGVPSRPEDATDSARKLLSGK